MKCCLNSLGYGEHNSGSIPKEKSLPRSSQLSIVLCQAWLLQNSSPILARKSNWPYTDLVPGILAVVSSHVQQSYVSREQNFTAFLPTL